MKNLHHFTNYILATAGVLAILAFPKKVLSQNTVQEKNKKIIQEGFDKWSAATGSFFDLLTEDMRWEITGSSSLSKKYTGKKQFMDEVITPLNQRLSKKIVPKVRYLFADKDWVIALWDGQATASDGQPYNMSYAWFMQMQNGKITNVVAFLDGLRFEDILKRIAIERSN